MKTDRFRSCLAVGLLTATLGPWAWADDTTTTVESSAVELSLRTRDPNNGRITVSREKLDPKTTAVVVVDIELFLAPDGDDSNPGTADRPLATLTAARDAVRRLIAAGLDADVTVFIRGGTYRLQETVVFGLEDSGTEKHAVTYTACPHQTPVFSSGLPIRNWRRLDEALPGLPDVAKDKVWIADLPDKLDSFRTLYDGPKRLPRARTAGFTPAKRYPQTRIPDWRNTLEFPPGTIKNWRCLPDVEILIVPQYPWVSNLLPLASVDEKKAVARTSVPATYPMGQAYFSRFPDGTLWVENVPEALDQPGEWVVDTSRRKLYLWPVGGEPSETIVAPCLSELIRVEGAVDYDGPTDKPVRNLAFRGLTFTHGDRWPWEEEKVGWGLQHDWEMFDRPTALVRFRGAEDCVVEDCQFVNSGGAALRLDLHCRRNRLEGNHLGHLGGVGILLAGYGPGTKDVNRENVVVDNRIHHVGELLWHSPGVFAWQSGQNRIANNLIHHTPYTAIVVSGRIHWQTSGQGECSKTIRWAEIEPAAPDLADAPDWHDREPFLHGRDNLVWRNEIHHAMQTLGDGNCIYVSGTGGGNVIRENYLHDVDTTNVNANIRCDDDQHQTLIEKNVIFRCCGEGFISKGNNTIRNNMIVDLRTATTAGIECGHQRGYLVFPYGPVQGSVIRANVFYSRQPEQILLHEGRRGDSRSLLRDCEADFNLYFNAADASWGRRHIETQRQFGVEQNSIAEDPLFVDLEAGDLRLEPDSPALKLGFEQIDLNNAGPTK